MIGQMLHWVCNSCKTEMNDSLGITKLYSVDGESPFVKVVCDRCQRVYYVHLESGETVSVYRNQSKVEEIGTCAF